MRKKREERTREPLQGSNEEGHRVSKSFVPEGQRDELAKRE